MKINQNKIIACIGVFLIFAVFLSYNEPKLKTQNYKILQVIEADKYYLDFNNDGKIQDEELVYLDGIHALTSTKNSKTQENISKFGLSLDEFLEVGYLAKKFATDNYLYKNIDFYKTVSINGRNYARLVFENQDIAKVLLKNGLAYTSNRAPIDYFQYQNIAQIRKNFNEIKKLDFVLVNLRNNLIHELNSEHAKEIHNAQVFLRKLLPLEKYKLCSFCYKNQKEIQKFENKFQLFPKSKNKYLKSFSKKFGEIELIILNPYEFNKPSDTSRTVYSKKIISEINQASKTIDFAIFDYSSQKDILNALINARKRNVKIRCVTQFNKTKDDYFSQTQTIINEFNCKVNDKPIIMHDKFFIFDDKKVLTGSTNITSSCSGGYNANNAVLINSVDLAKEFKEEFEQMFSLKFSNKKKNIETIEHKFAYGTFKASFSPKSNVVNDEIIKNIQNAKHEIIVSAFYLTHKDIIDELINAKKRGVDVYILLDALSATNFKDRVYSLRNAKIPVKVENWGGKNHEKTIVFDEEIILIGSANFSKSAFMKNDENLILIKSKPIAQTYRDYFFYLFSKIDNKYLYLIPRAESLESGNSCADGIDNNFDGKIDQEDDGCKVKSKIFN